MRKDLTTNQGFLWALIKPGVPGGSPITGIPGRPQLPTSHSPHQSPPLCPSMWQWHHVLGLVCSNQVTQTFWSSHPEDGKITLAGGAVLWEGLGWIAQPSPFLRAPACLSSSHSMTTTKSSRTVEFGANRLEVSNSPGQWLSRKKPPLETKVKIFWNLWTEMVNKRAGQDYPTSEVSWSHFCDGERQVFVGTICQVRFFR